MIWIEYKSAKYKVWKEQDGWHFKIKTPNQGSFEAIRSTHGLATIAAESWIDAIK